MVALLFIVFSTGARIIVIPIAPARAAPPTAENTPSRKGEYRSKFGET